MATRPAYGCARQERSRQTAAWRLGESSKSLPKYSEDTPKALRVYADGIRGARARPGSHFMALCQVRSPNQTQTLTIPSIRPFLSRAATELRFRAEGRAAAVLVMRRVVCWRRGHK